MPVHQRSVSTYWCQAGSKWSYRPYMYVVLSKCRFQFWQASLFLCGVQGPHCRGSRLSSDRSCYCKKSLALHFWYWLSFFNQNVDSWEWLWAAVTITLIMSPWLSLKIVFFLVYWFIHFMQYYMICCLYDKIQHATCLYISAQKVSKFMRLEDLGDRL